MIPASSQTLAIISKVFSGGNSLTVSFVSLSTILITILSVFSSTPHTHSVLSSFLLISSTAFLTFSSGGFLS